MLGKDCWYKGFKKNYRILAQEIPIIWPLLDLMEPRALAMCLWAYGRNAKEISKEGNPPKNWQNLFKDGANRSLERSVDQFLPRELDNCLSGMYKMDIIPTPRCLELSYFLHSINLTIRRS